MSSNPARETVERPIENENAHPQEPNNLAAEEEFAAARDEPMGSIAAAVPGSNARAQEAIETGQRPGAEETEIRDEPETTAGTEVKTEAEEAHVRKARSA